MKNDLKEKNILRTCKRHGLTNYRLNNVGHYKCLVCASDAVKNKRRELKKKAVKYLGNKCEICGYTRYVGSLEFHHKDPKEKDFSMSHGGETRSWDKIKIELDKCNLVCSNCHKEIHAGVTSIK